MKAVRNVSMIALFCVAAILVIGISVAQAAKKEKKPAEEQAPKPDPRAPIEDVAGLPRVLLIGDSISLGYTLDVRKALEGKANVHRPSANCGSTAMGVKNLDAWLGDGKWDVIHFNWGLWDICRRVNGKRNLDGPIAASEEDYAKRLEELVQRLQKTGAKLIWANTTYVQGGWGRRQGDEVKYNAIAAKIMEKYGVEIDDVHAVTATFGPELFRSKGNVHFTDEGYALIAKQVAKSIEGALSAKK